VRLGIEELFVLYIFLHFSTSYFLSEILRTLYQLHLVESDQIDALFSGEQKPSCLDVVLLFAELIKSMHYANFWHVALF
jgi:hypothetical protein